MAQPEIARCLAEIAAMEAHTEDPAWLVTLGITDWEYEMELLRQKQGSDLLVARTGS